MNIIKRHGVWRLYDPQATLILTDERQLTRIVNDPDASLFDDETRGHSGESHGIYPPGTTLNTFMAQAASDGATRVEVSYDFFFGGSTRENYPDSPLTVAAFKVIHDAALRHGMTFGASLISPLDLGGGYAKRHKNVGKTWQMGESVIENGEYRLHMRRQRQWYNNKGPIALKLNKVYAMAFTDSEDHVVNPEDIIDITASVSMRDMPDTDVTTGAGYGYSEMEVYGETTCGGRVMVIVEYLTPEMDYFAPDTADYIKSVIDMHADAGIRYQGFYSDEMHIQFDWDLAEHFGQTEIRTRHVTDNLIKEYARRYGEQYRDFLKYMVYFLYTPERQYILSDRATTLLFRKRYFEMLSERVLTLSMDAKAYAESRFGAPIMTRAHATWQESPTCDHFSRNWGFTHKTGTTTTRYDYDTPYDWGASIRENMSACYDYFRWNRFLSGSGTDHPEGGNLDRNYYAQALASSFGALNAFERAYCACWGSPKPVIRRFDAVGAAYGTGHSAGSINHGIAQDMRHRTSDVLILYPIDLNYAEERFGSWMVQYGYADYITQEELITRGAVKGDRIIVGDRQYRALVTMYELFVTDELMDMITQFVRAGGRMLWTATPPIASIDGDDVSAWFKDIFALTEFTTKPMPPCGAVSFCDAFNGIDDMRPLTKLLPDAWYPMNGNAIAKCGDITLGCQNGNAVYLGFRPRDDQSMSLNEDVATLFEVLKAVGAYGEDSLELISRPESARYIMGRFLSGAITIANHYRRFAEDWQGNFFRDEAQDAEYLQGRELPSIDLDLNQSLGGYRVKYSGTDALTFRVENGELVAFSGQNCKGISIDGTDYAFTDAPKDLTFALIAPRHYAANIARLALVRGDGALRLPKMGFGASARASTLINGFYDTGAAVDMRIDSDIMLTAIPDRWIAIYEVNYDG